MAQFNMTKRVFARERINPTNAGVTTLTPATYNASASPVALPQMGQRQQLRATGAVLFIESGSVGGVHFTVDGTAPTSGTTSADVGGYAAAADVLTLESYEAIELFKVRALTAAGGVPIEVWYLR